MWKDALVVDLRSGGRWRRRRAGDSNARLDGWAARASPWEHGVVAQRGCKTAECRDRAWAEHCATCENCDREEGRARIRRMAARVRAWREATS